jgi:hypothetical protein
MIRRGKLEWMRAEHKKENDDRGFMENERIIMAAR